jgi:hypothetical protein
MEMIVELSIDALVERQEIPIILDWQRLMHDRMLLVNDVSCVLFDVDADSNAVVHKS